MKPEGNWIRILVAAIENRVEEVDSDRSGQTSGTRGLLVVTDVSGRTSRSDRLHGEGRGLAIVMHTQW